MSRSKPYSIENTKWASLLRTQHIIPMNQREYSWGDEEIKKFLDDIVHMEDEGKYIFRLGSIIKLKCMKGNIHMNDIYDGQQRLLTTVLILFSLGYFSDYCKEEAKRLVLLNNYSEISEEQKLRLKTHNVKYHPKITCINPRDMKALMLILNDEIDFYNNYDKGVNNDKYICSFKDCKYSATRVTDFINHLQKKHSYQFIKNREDTRDESKLYNAIIYIHKYFRDKIKEYKEKKIDEIAKIVKIYNFIMEDIDIQLFECDDYVYVSKIFDWENNRGKPVEVWDLVKNPILVNIPEDKKIEVYTKWEELKNSKDKSKVYTKNYGQKIFEIAIQLYNKEFNRTLNYNNLFEKIINPPLEDNTTTYDEINKFFGIVEDLKKIMKDIENDRYGKLLNENKRISLNWEAYLWCLLPISYIEKQIPTKLIKLFAKWYFRRLGFKLRGFNNLSYSEVFIKTINEVLNPEKDCDYYKVLKDCLTKNIEDSIKDEEKYRSSLAEKQYKNIDQVKFLLRFLESTETTDILPVPCYTLEHIIPQKIESDFVHRLGNLTLYEGSNSDNGHRGNCSLGDKDFSEKIKQYKNSSCKLTREINEKYSTFEEAEVEERSHYLAEKIHIATSY